MKIFRKNKRIIKGTNAIDPATTTSKKWGYKPVPGKGGATTNYDAERKDSECKDIIFGRKAGAVNA